MLSRILLYIILGPWITEKKERKRKRENRRFEEKEKKDNSDLLWWIYLLKLTKII